MITTEEIKISECMENKWLNFITMRNKKVFEKHDKRHGAWISILQREEMINKYIAIMKKIRNRRRKLNE